MKTQIISISMICIGVMSLASCHHGAIYDPPRKAVLMDHGPDTLAEISDVISRALDGRNVSLSAVELTQTPDIIIERQSRRTLSHTPIDGRRLDRPDRFRLLTDGRQCYLKHLNTADISLLKTTACHPLP